MFTFLFVLFSVYLIVKFVRRRRIIRKTRQAMCTAAQHLLVNSELNYVWGLPGAGKSTLLAAVAQTCYEMGIPCFSNYPIRHSYKFQGFEVNYPVGSVFLLDEIYDLIGSGTNRGILPADVSMFFKTFRHNRYTIWACSQEVDDVARRVRGVVTSAWQLKYGHSYSSLRAAEIREVKDVDGDKFVLKSGSLGGFFKDIRIRRSDFYDDFDSYSRKFFENHATFDAW